MNKKDYVLKYISCKYAYINNKGNVHCDNYISIMCGLCRIAQEMYNKSLNKNKHENS